MDKIKYLGVWLSNDPCSHAEDRIKSCRQAFYALQGAGLCGQGLSPETSAHVWTAAVRPVLTYGAHCVNLSKSALKDMDKIQGKLIKTILGVKDYCHSSPLLNALNMNTITKSREVAQLKLLKRAVINTSGSSNFYCYLLSLSNFNNPVDKRNLVSRCIQTCRTHGFNLLDFLHCNRYASQSLKTLVKFPKEDGVMDSVKQLLQYYDKDKMVLLNMLLKAY